MTPKTKKIVNIVATAIPVLLVYLSGTMKFLATPDMIAKMEKVGIASFLPMLGTMEIVFATLFIFPKTMRIGFILLSCYFAGAIATDLSHGGSMANAMLPIILVWISAFIRDRTIFLPITPKRKSAFEL